jgi:general secretion pathway protein K
VTHWIIKSPPAQDDVFFKSYNLRDGYVLVFVLWTMALLIGSAMVFIFSEKLNTRATYTLKGQALARAAALRAFAEAVLYLESDKDPQVDFIDEKGNLRLDTKSEPFPHTLNYEHSIVEVTITDELSKININYIPSPLLQNMLTRLGYEPDEISTMIDCLNDWIDPDSLHRLQGAEQEYYEPLGYLPKNSLIDDIGELNLIKGFGPKVLEGDKDHPPLAPHITVFGRGGLNVNTASAETLYLLGLSRTEVQSIIEARKDGGLRVLTPEMLTAGLNRTASDIFRIEIIAKLKTHTTVGYNIISIVKRQPYKGSYRSTILYWKENADYTGS